jgi:hypothetical protein
MIAEPDWNSTIPKIPNNDYHHVVESATQTLLGKVRYHGSVAVSVATFVAMSIHPVPWCVDCEFPNPWGHIANRTDDFLCAWALIAPFIAGLFEFKNGWLVPACIVIFTLITQPLGGVPWWSLLANEGPLIVIIGLPTCMGCFILGKLLRLAISSAKRGIEPGEQM